MIPAPVTQIVDGPNNYVKILPGRDFRSNLQGKSNEELKVLISESSSDNIETISQYLKDVIENLVLDETKCINWSEMNNLQITKWKTSSKTFAKHFYNSKFRVRQLLKDLHTDMSKNWWKDLVAKCKEVAEQDLEKFLLEGILSEPAYSRFSVDLRKILAGHMKAAILSKSLTPMPRITSLPSADFVAVTDELVRAHKEAGQSFTFSSPFEKLFTPFEVELGTVAVCPCTECKLKREKGQPDLPTLELSLYKEKARIMVSDVVELRVLEERFQEVTICAVPALRVQYVPNQTDNSSQQRTPRPPARQEQGISGQPDSEQSGPNDTVNEDNLDIDDAVLLAFRGDRSETR